MLGQKVLIGIEAVLEPRVFHNGKWRWPAYPSVFFGLVPAYKGFIFLKVVETAEMLHLKAEPGKPASGQQHFFSPFMDGPLNTIENSFFINEFHDHQGSVNFALGGKAQD
jgi:hypothetical protein